MTKNVCYFDIESHNAEKRYDMAPEDFGRLYQYAWNDGPVILTTDLEEMREQIRKADMSVAHNGHAFDLTAVFGKDSIEPLEIAMENRFLDTMVLASIVNPAPYMFTMRNGRKVFDGASPERAKTWLSLDNQCFQLKVPGKIGSLQDLAKKYNPPKTKVSDLDYSLIPVDDPEFVEYAIQDVVALRDLARKLIDMNKNGFVVPWAYAHREQQFAAINAQMSRNGFRVDINLAQKRVEELAIKREELMTRLVEEYDFPTEGKSPWASSAGKEATEKILKSYGLDVHHKSWPKTPKGAPQLGGKILIEMTEGTDAEEVGTMLAELKGQRSLAQLALDSTFSDGRVHPEVTTFQRSGRSSLQKPGLTVWTARGEGAVEKAYFIASEGHKLVEMDYSNADARIVAAYSGDAAFAQRFEPGADGHEINARIVFGEDYDNDPKNYRQASKGMGHGWSYRGGPKALAKAVGKMLTALGLDPIETCRTFIDRMNNEFWRVVRWQDRVTKEGESGWVVNDWGRRMMVDQGRSYTQSPALYGQSGTREIMVDGLIRIANDDINVLRWLVATVHDAIILDVPESEMNWAPEWIKERMETTFRPAHAIGLAIPFPMEIGPAGSSWHECSH